MRSNVKRNLVMETEDAFCTTILIPVFNTSWLFMELDRMFDSPMFRILPSFERFWHSPSWSEIYTTSFSSEQWFYCKLDVRCRNDLVEDRSFLHLTAEITRNFRMESAMIENMMELGKEVFPIPVWKKFHWTHSEEIRLFICRFWSTSLYCTVWTRFL